MQAWIFNRLQHISLFYNKIHFLWRKLVPRTVSSILWSGERTPSKHPHKSVSLILKALSAIAIACSSLVIFISVSFRSIVTNSSSPPNLCTTSLLRPRINFVDKPNRGPCSSWRKFSTIRTTTDTYSSRATWIYVRNRETNGKVVDLPRNKLSAHHVSHPLYSAHHVDSFAQTVLWDCWYRR